MTLGMALSDVNITIADVEYDWLVTRAAIGGNAYDPVLSLAQDEGVQIHVVLAADGSADVLHPRTPGAILILLPLRLVPFAYLAAMITGLSVSVLIWFGWTWLTDGSGTAARKAVWLGVGAVSAPVVMTLAYAAQSLVVATLVIGAIVGSRRGKRALPALLAACAIVLKLFPAALLVFWWARGRRATVFGTVAGVAGLTLLGLLLPGVSLVDASAALSTALTDFVRVPTNGSLAAVLVDLGVPTFVAATVCLTGLGVLGAYAALWPKMVPPSASLTLLVFLVLQPISWASFDVALVAFVVVVVGGGDRSNLTFAIPLLMWVLLTVSWLAAAAETAAIAFLTRGVVLLAVFLPHRTPDISYPAVGLAGDLASDLAATGHQSQTSATVRA